MSKRKNPNDPVKQRERRLNAIKNGRCVDCLSPALKTTKRSFTRCKFHLIDAAARAQADRDLRRLRNDI
jgi:hypothetical protein